MECPVSTLRYLLIACLLCLGTALSAPKQKIGNPQAASRGPVPPASVPLDKGKVVKLYNEGDFDPAILILEEFQRTHARFTREESLMVYKYLGVMYCADPQTREKGKTYFYKLLKVDSEAKILDMYVSIMVQEIFKNTLEELMGGMPVDPESPRAKTAPGPGAATAASEPGPSRPVTTDHEARLSEERGKTAYWWIGVGALAVAGGGYYLYSQADAKPASIDIEVTP